MDLQATALGGLKSACRIFSKDLQALPEDAFCRRFGPATRTVADIVYEVNLVNDHVGIVMRGEEPFPWPEVDRITAPEDFREKATVLEAFERSSARILATVESFSEAEMEAPLPIENGETTRFERCRFMTLHLWYHSGQLNFIQTLLGDTGWHWS